MTDKTYTTHMNLTKTSIARFKIDNGKDEQIVWDEAMPGFGLRCRKSEQGESRTFIVQYKVGAKNRRLSLGKVGKVDADTARSKAKRIFGKLVDGDDPANERAQKRAAAANTFGKAAADFLEVQKKRLKPLSYDAAERYINEHFKPLHGLAVASINRATVAAQLRVIAKENGPVSADRARANLSKLFTWAVAEGLADFNPVLGTNKHSEDLPRDRVLTDEELAAVWNAAPDSDFGWIVKLLMLTGQRRDEIGSLRWSEIKDGNSIALPAERTKNSRPHDVPLSADALAILKGISQRGDRDFVFGQSRQGGFCGWGAAKRALDEASGVTGWRLHDLRRTAATRMADAGVQPHIVETVLNHASGFRAGDSGTYNRALYSAEKRDALDRLASYIKTALAKADGGNITRLRTAG